MDLIDRAAVKAGMMKYGFLAPDMTVHEFVEDELPAVPAVPLESLCEWLNVHSSRPIDCVGKMCGQCEYDKFDSYKECWKALLKKWMEGLDADNRW